MLTFYVQMDMLVALALPYDFKFLTEGRSLCLPAKSDRAHLIHSISELKVKVFHNIRDLSLELKLVVLLEV